MAPAGPIVGVAGLTELFSTCIHTWGYLSTVRPFSRELELQQTKLDIEKTLFLQWGLRVGIVNVESDPEGLDPRLSDEKGDTHQAVISILLSMKRLFTNANDLQLKYGVVCEEIAALDCTDYDLQIISGRLMVRVQEWQDKIKGRETQSSKTRWICRDQDKFTVFVNKVISFNEELNTLTPTSQFIQELVLKQTMHPFRIDLSMLHRIRDATQSLHTTWSEAARDLIVAYEGPSNYSETGTNMGTTDYLIANFLTGDARPHLSRGDTSDAKRTIVNSATLDNINKAVGVVGSFYVKLSRSWAPLCVEVASSGVCDKTVTKLKLYETKLKKHKWASKEREVVEVGIDDWMDQVERTTARVNQLAGLRLMAIFFPPEDKHLGMQITDIADSLDVIVGNALMEKYDEEYGPGAVSENGKK